MIQKDYFMKIAEMLATVIAKVLLKKDQKKFIEAEQELEEASLSIAGIDLKLVKLFSAEDLIKLIKTSDLFAGKCIASAELLYEYGKLKELTGNSQESIDSYLKSVQLFIEAVISKDLPDNSTYILKIEELIPKVNASEVTNKMNLRLLDYYALTKQFSKYEDTAFDLLENFDNSDIESDVSETYTKIIRYFQKLKSLPEEELLNGNLSKAEVEEALEEILLLQNKNN